VLPSGPSRSKCSISLDPVPPPKPSEPSARLCDDSQALPPTAVSDQDAHEHAPAASLAQKTKCSKASEDFSGGERNVRDGRDATAQPKFSLIDEPTNQPRICRVEKVLIDALQKFRKQLYSSRTTSYFITRSPACFSDRRVAAFNDDPANTKTFWAKGAPRIRGGLFHENCNPDACARSRNSAMLAP